MFPESSACLFVIKLGWEEREQQEEVHGETRTDSKPCTKQMKAKGRSQDERKKKEKAQKQRRRRAEGAFSIRAKEVQYRMSANHH